MKANQKYFPLLDAEGRLTNRFLVVCNIRPADASRVIDGNERVVRPRLADAKFFFDQDRKKTLASRVPALDKVVYHGKLGTPGRARQRVRAIAREIARQLGGEALAAQADRAAMLAKADLLTDMVGEFPELQGTMGGYYARHDGESDEIAHGDRRPLQAALCRRRPAAQRDRRRGRAGRQARDAGRAVRHRPAADRRQGPVRAAAPRAGRDPHGDRTRVAARRCRISSRRRSPPFPRRAMARPMPRSASSCASGSSAICASRATARRRSRR